MQYDVFATEAGNFRSAKTRLYGKQQECPIATSAPGVEVGGREQSVDFSGCEE
jgi:hypothetical protein